MEATMVVRKKWLVLVLFVYSIALFPYAALAQGSDNKPVYRLGSGDIISITVPQRPDLNREVEVAEDGAITLPLVGKIMVKGLTVDEAESRILAGLRDVYPSVNDIEVKAEPAGAYLVYVVGGVGKPGKYAFQEAPSLWDAIREAGGASGTANLDQVRIVKDAAKGGTSQVVNVEQAIESGSVEQLPKLDDEDTVIVPIQELTYRGEFAVDVFGAVQKPGTYRLTSKNNLIEALLLAGGTIPEARMSRISVVRPLDDGSYEAVLIDIRKFLEDGEPLANPGLKPGDTVYVPRQNSFLYSLKTNAGSLIGVVTAVTTLVLLVNNN